MKHSKVSILFLLFFFSALILFADDLFIVFMEGVVKVKTNTGWQTVSIGDSLELSSMVTLESGAILEIASESTTITIYDEGTYTLKDLVNSLTQVKSQPTLYAVDSRIQNIVQGNKYHRSSAAGLRGFDRLSRGSDPISVGQKMLAQGRYDDAIKHFNKLLDEWPYEEARPFFIYYLAYAHAEKQEKARALKLLDSLSLEDSHVLYADYIMLKGRLLLESFAYKRALDIFEQYLTLNIQDEKTQAILILGSLCYRGLGSGEKEKEYLVEAEKIGPDSPLGLQARKLLDSM
jgi:tetratricopeptide (TPR) repeat protein